MENIPQIYDIAKTLYDKLIKFTMKMYNFIGSEYDVSQKNLVIGVDHFVQAILFRVALADDVLKDIELQFIKAIVEEDDFFKDLHTQHLNELSADEKVYYINKCNEILAVVPEFVKLSVLCDKKVDLMCEVISPTYCQKVYDYLKRIANYLTFIDGRAQEVEDKTHKIVLDSVVKYYKKHYVKYAPNRKK